MSRSSALTRSLHTLQYETGAVIPFYMPGSGDPESYRAMLCDTVSMMIRELADPQMLVLSVDGPGSGVAIAQAVADETGITFVASDRNQGKFGAVALGMRALLAVSHLRYLAVIDSDGDHFGNELLNLVRAAHHVAASAATDNVMVLGSRLSRHRPLGFLRAEQEELANRMLLDALTYHAAIHNTPMRCEYLTTTESLPDFHSGYKLFSRRAAQAVFAQDPPLAGLDETAAYRHACEAVMTVEAHLAGAYLAAVSRSTFDEQPISNYATYDRAQLAANMILWPCKRLNAPGHFVAQWLANHIPALTLGTLAPQGQEELAAIRRLLLHAYGLDPETTQPPLLARPRFV